MRKCRGTVVLKDTLEVIVQKQWYAIYTRPRAEKRVYSYLQEQGIEAFLPIQKSLRIWSDRKKMVEVPLFTSYVFVKVDSKEHYYVLKTFGVVKYICFEGRAVAIPQSQIDNLFLLVNSDAELEATSRKFLKGQNVEVVLGSLKGLTGELVKTGRKNRVLVRIDHLEQNLLVNIPISYLK